ncbi:MAG: Gfo/Idh/MocA family oxidoreductase, partial [Acidobacteria bacterium]|nr:Gfo/Idh/MocA family oxidoreductase [Acidobacteriota bacterium]
MESSTQRKLRGAIVGCGFFGRIQWDAWLRMPGVEMVAACDGMLDRAASFGVPAYKDAEAMLRAHSLDFLDIATRPASHLHLVKLAVAAKLPCICQKPIAETIEQAAEMERIAARAGVRI